MNTQSKWLNQISQWDIQLFSWCMARNCRPALARAGRIISHTADGYGYVAIPALLALSAAAVPSGFYAMLALAFVVERSLYFVLKHGFKRNRPEQAIRDFYSWIKPSDQFSFPSGHTSGAFLFSGFLTLLAPEFGWLVFGWAGCVGLSRFFLGVHFMTDVVIGALIGFTISQSFIALLVE